MGKMHNIFWSGFEAQERGAHPEGDPTKGRGISTKGKWERRRPRRRLTLGSGGLGRRQRERGPLKNESEGKQDRHVIKCRRFHTINKFIASDSGKRGESRRRKVSGRTGKARKGLRGERKKKAETSIK